MFNKNWTTIGFVIPEFKKMDKNINRNMKNVKDEFLEEIKDKEVMCAWIRHSPDLGPNPPCYELKPGFSQKDFEDFLISIDFGHNASSCSQELFGYIWYANGAWSELEEDEYQGGLEQWRYRKREDIPEDWEGDLDV